MKVSLTILFALLAVLSTAYAEKKCGYKAYAKFVKLELRKKLVEIEAECFKEANITPTHLMLRDTIVDIKKVHDLHCFDKCVYDKYGVWSDDDKTKVDPAKCKDALETKTHQFVDVCINNYANETDLCEKAYLTNDCFVQKICDMYE